MSSIVSVSYAVSYSRIASIMSPRVSCCLMTSHDVSLFHSVSCCLIISDDFSYCLIVSPTVPLHLIMSRSVLCCLIMSLDVSFCLTVSHAVSMSHGVS